MIFIKFLEKLQKRGQTIKILLETSTGLFSFVTLITVITRSTDVAKIIGDFIIC